MKTNEILDAVLDAGCNSEKPEDRSVNLKVIDINWEGSFKVEYDRKNDQYELGNMPPDLLNKSGFYQIYGRHPVYGRDVLLYIGETEKNENGDRSFETRLKEHLQSRFYYHTNLSIFFGPSELNGEDIKLVESILISSHIPALNRHHIDWAKDKASNILVRNLDFIGSLERVCAGYLE